MEPTVVWTSRAEQRLEVQLRRALPPGGPDPQVVGLMAELDRRLAAAFRHLGAVVVLDVYSGYRPRETDFVLRCDLRDGRRKPGGTVIVKLTTDKSDRPLRAERDAWESTHPSGFVGDAVFMVQEPHPDPDEPHRVVAVAYRDAQPFIGTDEQMSLAAAFDGAVRFDSPTAASVADAVRVVFEHLYRGFHHRDHTAEPLDQLLRLNRLAGGERRSLLDRLRGWESDPGLRVRQQVYRQMPATVRWFLDPLAFFPAMTAVYAAGGPDARRYALHPRRGPAHGDLHGYNVLLGRTGERVHSPAVFDYEHMNPDNLIALDFVKLETELKVRAYRHLFPYDEPADGLPPRHFVEEVARVEGRLWGVVAAGAARTDRERRLEALLAVVRDGFLTRDRSDPDGRRREYAFLLAAYAAGTIHFPNLTLGERTVALVSAGVAAHQFVALSDARTLPPEG